MLYRTTITLDVIVQTCNDGVESPIVDWVGIADQRESIEIPINEATVVCSLPLAILTERQLRELGEDEYYGYL